MRCVVCNGLHLKFPYNCEQRAKKLKILDEFYDYISAYNLYSSKKDIYGTSISGKKDEIPFG